MAEMTNVSDIVLKVKISMGPRSKPMITTMEPGTTAQFPDGYCESVKGPGPDRLPCILSRSNSHNGVPALVPVAEAEEARARYVRVSDAIAGRNRNPQAEIRRLEAEMAAMRVAARAPVAKAAAPAADPEPVDDLEDATTPKAPKRSRKAKD